MVFCSRGCSPQDIYHSDCLKKVRRRGRVQGSVFVANAALTPPHTSFNYCSCHHEHQKQQFACTMLTLLLRLVCLHAPPRCVVLPFATHPVVHRARKQGNSQAVSFNSFNMEC